VAVVAHADVIKVLIAHYVGLPLDLFQRLEVGTASVSVLSFGTTGSRLLALNVTGGLPQLPVDEAERAHGVDSNCGGPMAGAAATS
jgi:probable phosphoglycerate mutase